MKQHIRRNRAAGQVAARVEGGYLEAPVIEVLKKRATVKKMKPRNKK